MADEQVEWLKPDYAKRMREMMMEVDPGKVSNGSDGRHAAGAWKRESDGTGSTALQGTPQEKEKGDTVISSGGSNETKRDSGLALLPPTPTSPAPAHLVGPAPRLDPGDATDTTTSPSSTTNATTHAPKSTTETPTTTHDALLRPLTPLYPTSDGSNRELPHELRNSGGEERWRVFRGPNEVQAGTERSEIVTHQERRRGWRGFRGM
jgi:hypothetical protein